MASRRASKTKKKNTARVARPAKRANARVPRPAVVRPPRTSREDVEIKALNLFAEIEAAAGAEIRLKAERAAARSLEFFLRKMGHDFANAFGGLGSLGQKLEAQVAAPELDRGAIAELLASERQIVRKLTRTLDRARDAVLNVSPHMTHEPVAALVEEMRATVVSELGERASRLELTLDVEEGLSLDADYSYLLEALVDLVRNAAEAYPPTRSTFPVRFSARRRGRTVEFVVEDDGFGWHADVLAYAFTPFATSKPIGTGLGMYIARRAIEERHGGWLAVSSEGSGRGSRVRAVVPYKQKDVQDRRRFTTDEIFDGTARRYLDEKEKRRKEKRRK